ncbi:hypothetical protein [Thiocapsa imhoffii]|nr:hypothetical protein [Thiocapsa imhoffii]
MNQPSEPDFAIADRGVPWLARIRDLGALEALGDQVLIYGLRAPAL